MTTYKKLHLFLTKCNPTKILVVGDGNCSFTMFFIRNSSKYGKLDMETSTVLSEEDHFNIHGTVRIAKKLKSLDIPLRFSVDATKLDKYTLPSYNTVIWCYPFPESNNGNELTKLIHDFMEASYRKGISNVILGLKSLEYDSDHQLNRVDISNNKYTLSGSMVCKPFWKSIHVSGKPLDKKLNTYITFYHFKSDK